TLTRHIPAVTAGSVVETTGAGDAFNGGLASALAEGMDLIESTKFACVVAGISVTRPRNAPSLPSPPRNRPFHAKPSRDRRHPRHPTRKSVMSRKYPEHRSPGVFLTSVFFENPT